jgi:hypothetical protein
MPGYGTATAPTPYLVVLEVQSVNPSAPDSPTFPQIQSKAGQGSPAHHYHFALTLLGRDESHVHILTAGGRGKMDTGTMEGQLPSTVPPTHLTKHYNQQAQVQPQLISSVKRKGDLEAHKTAI